MIKPLRAKGTDGLRAHTLLCDEWSEYSRLDVDMTMKIYENIKNKKVNESMRKIPFIKNVIFNEPATIVFWSDNTKTVVKCHNEKFDPEKGLAMAIAKKALGNEHDYYAKNFEKWLPKSEVKVEPEKPKRMTFREEEKLKHPDRVDDGYIGGVRGCPKDRPLGGLRIDCDLRKASMHCMLSRAMKDEICRNCWDREIPEEKKPVEDAVLRKGDKVVKVRGENDTIDNHPIGAVLEVTCARDNIEYVSTLGPSNKCPNSKVTQSTYRSCLKKLAKDQTLKKGDKVVVIKKPSFLCDYNIGDILKITHINPVMFKFNESVECSRCNDYHEQILKASEVVKIVE